jgi:hypothetical protein
MENPLKIVPSASARMAGVRLAVKNGGKDNSYGYRRTSCLHLRYSPASGVTNPQNA